MKDPKTLAIGMLLVTAAFLSAMIVLSYAQTGGSAVAGSPGMQGGDYVIGTGSTRGDEEVIYVIDGQSQRMAVYEVDERTNRMETVAAVNFANVRTFK
jgi:hypothetical protein